MRRFGRELAFVFRNVTKDRGERLLAFPWWLIRVVHAVPLSLLLSLTPHGLRGVRAAATRRR
jgi:hypothetical protein